MKVDEKTTVLLQDEILAQPRVYIEGQPAPSVIEKFYTAGEVDNLFNALNEKVDEVKSEIPSLEGYATENYVDEKIDAIPEPDLSNYVTDGELESALSDKADKSEIPSLEGYATETYVDEKIGEIEIPESDVNLSAYVGGVSITGEVNGSTADVLNYANNGGAGTITVGWNNPGDASQPDFNTYSNNIFVKGWAVDIIAGNMVYLKAGINSITVNETGGMNLSVSGSDINLDANNLLWKGTGLNYSNGLCLLNNNGNIPFYVSEPYIYRTDDLDSDGVYFNFSDSKIDWYTHYNAWLTFITDADIYYAYPDGSTKSMYDNCITKEIWISPVSTIEVISIPEYVQVIGEMPTSLEPTKEIIYNGSSYNKQLTHVFVVRGINYNGKWIYTINYAYNFISNYDEIYY